MALNYDFPGNLPTNTYILQDFSEVAYIVCTGVIPISADKSNNLPEINSKQRVLARLNNAEQQFRQASILTVLDAEKLELFTFYKKVDIVKDQKTILTKFGQVCKLNNCNIAYKNACRVIELLRPDMARIYRLFTTAVLSSLHIRDSNESKTIGLSSHIYLSQATGGQWHDWLPTEGTWQQWLLEKVDLQIVPSGQLLLGVRHAKWGSLVAMSDLIDPELWPVNHEKGTTVYLAPTGQLALYKGIWSVFPTTTPLAVQSSLGQNDVYGTMRKSKWIEKITKWFHQRFDSLPMSEGGLMWLEVDIPVLESSSDFNTKDKALIWRRIYWPVSKTYAFISLLKSKSKDHDGEKDPLMVAEEWFTKGAAASQVPEVELNDELNTTYGNEEERLFDEEIQFDSPQQFMNVPPHVFPQSQTVYPTPPDGFNAQATPGISVDGAGQTPATTSLLHANTYNSSPLATMTDIGSVAPNEPGTQEAISNFLNHNEDGGEGGDIDDDLFDDIDTEKLEQNPYGDEPNWDFFDADNATVEAKQRSASNAADTSQQAKQATETTKEASNIEITSPEPTDTVDELVTTASPRDDSTNLTDLAGKQDHVIGDTTEKTYEHSPQDLHTQLEDTTKLPDTNLVKTEPTPRDLNKRRRFSVYDLSLSYEDERDLKYTRAGKYWFEPKKPDYPAGTRHQAPALNRKQTSSSSASSLSDIVSPDVSGNRSSTKFNLWTEYDVNTQDSPEMDKEMDLSNDVNLEEELEDLLYVVSGASGLEPFTSLLPIKPVNESRNQQDPERHSMVTQLLTEQLAYSSLFRNENLLAIPSANRSHAIEVSVDNAGSNSILPNATLGDLSAIQVSNVAAKHSRIFSFDHVKIKLRQAENEIVADLPILNYWEVLKLQPFSGPKDVLATCIAPESENYKQGCRAFIQRMSETWTSCNLGTHRVDSTEEIPDASYVSWKTDSDLHEVCRKLGEALVAAEFGDCNVVYMIIPDDDLSQCYKMCDAFFELYETLDQLKDSELREIVLQLVPSSFVIGVDTLVVPPEDDFVGLALELYDRIPPVVIHPDTTFSAPALVLGEFLPRHLQFELSTKASSPLIKHGHCCHLAYDLGHDGRYLVAAWSDSLGNITMTTSYCLIEERGLRIRSRSEVFRHMYETSVAMMNRQRELWWIAIVKVGLFESDELQDWSSATNPPNNENALLTRLVLLNVELEPRLAINCSTKPLKSFQQTSHNALNTPVSTPQAANTTSPEQMMPPTPTVGTVGAFNAPTPPEHGVDFGNDTDIYLVNPLEDKWGCTLSFGFNQSHNFLEVRPAQASGFLIKKCTSIEEKGDYIGMTGLNLVAVQRKQGSSNAVSLLEREQILEDVLTQYQNLHSLAIAKRFLDPNGICVPWHVAVAFKGARVLEHLV